MVVAEKKEEIEKKDDIDAATTVNYDTCFILYSSWFKPICTCYHETSFMRIGKARRLLSLLKMNTLNGH